MTATPWTKSEEGYLKSNYNRFTTQKMSEMLYKIFRTHRTPKAITRKMEIMRERDKKLKATKNYYRKKLPALKQHRKEFIKANFPQLSDEEMAKELGVSKGTISSYRRSLGLFRVGPPQTQEEKEKIYQERLKKSRERDAKDRKDIMDYKASKGCCICGETCPQALDFHHRDPSTKSFTIGAKSGSLETLKEEIDKCVVICANHHRMVHAGLIDLTDYL